MMLITRSTFSSYIFYYFTSCALNYISTFCARCFFWNKIHQAHSQNGGNPKFCYYCFLVISNALKKEMLLFPQESGIIAMIANTWGSLAVVIMAVVWGGNSNKN